MGKIKSNIDVVKKHTIVIVLLLFTVLQGAFAQRIISGKAISGEDGLAMPGVSVVVKGTTIGMTTDKDGNYALRVPDNAMVIVVSFMGFKTAEIPIGNFTYTQYNITLQPDAIALGDVVVTATRKNQREKVITAFGFERDPRSLPYALSHISGEELRKTSPSNLISALAGKVPNLNIYTVNTGAGSTSFASLRGITSFSGPIPLLYVIDGIPLRRSMEEDLSWLDIENIESVTVLRGANAAMLYGSDGSGGAILITTKRR